MKQSDSSNDLNSRLAALDRLLRPTTVGIPKPFPEDSSDHKDYPFAFWKQSARWQADLHNKAAHKALDIPDEMSVSATKRIDKSKHGVGPWGLLAASLGPTILGLAMLTMFLLNRTTPPPPVTQPLDSTVFQGKKLDYEVEIIQPEEEKP